jgi:hypothetical protein
MSRINKLTAQLPAPFSVFSPVITQEGRTTPAEWHSKNSGSFASYPRVTLLVDTKRTGLKSSKASVDYTLPTLDSEGSNVTHQSKAFVTFVMSELSTEEERRNLVKLVSDSLQISESQDLGIGFSYDSGVHLITEPTSYRVIPENYWNNVPSVSNSAKVFLLQNMVAPGIIAWRDDLTHAQLDTSQQTQLINNTTEYDTGSAVESTDFSIGSAIVDLAPAY